LNLEIEDREFVVLAGPSNCGISTIVRMIAGLADISGGDIFIGDRRVNDLPPKDRDVALVSRNHTLYPRMSVSDNVAFGLKSRKFPGTEIRKRVVAAAEVLGLQEILACKPDALSREQQQRVGIARALALQPKVFLFDQPLANLEPNAGGQLRNELAKLHQRLQATTIYATHDPVEALAMGGRIVVMKEGVIQQDETAATLYDQPANVFVAGYMGSPPMNLIRGALKQDRDRLIFSEADEGTIEARWAISDLPGGQDFVGRPVLLGIRPEEIRLAETSPAEKYSGNFPAIIDLVEAMGAEANLHLQTGAHTLVCRVPRGAISGDAGQRARFQLNLNKLHLFDPISTRRIV
jgi:multiple sugar transport system ATP-binding protein